MKDAGRKITVEDLLRLKRAERPPAEFWARFESEMRSKQLAAIVVRRPWWAGLSRAVSIVYRHQLSFGAAAALALTWVGVHYVGGHSPAAQAIPVRVEEPTAVAVVAAPQVAPAVARAPAPEEKPETDIRETAPSQQAVVESNPSHLTKAPEPAQADSLYGSPFGGGITATLADFRSADTDVAKRDVFSSDREFEEPSTSVRQQVTEPLTRVDPTGDRLERLLAPGLPVYTASSSGTLVSDRLKQKAADDRMYESMDRYGAGGMSLEFRF